MKNTTSCKFMLLVLWLTLPVLLFSQETSILDKKIKLSKTHYQLIELLDELTENHKLIFAYNSKKMPKAYTIVFVDEKLPLETLLEKLCAEFYLDCIVKGEIIILKKRKDKPKLKISGYVVDKQTGEKLPGAYVYDNLYNFNTVTDDFGYFSLPVPKGSLLLNFSYVGHKTHKAIFAFKGDTLVNIQLAPSGEIDEVEISYRRISDINKINASEHTLPAKLLKKAPIVVGEPDIAKALHCLPGVVQGEEGTSSFYVRGGNSDQNLILIDGMPIYNANHSMGIFSIFNTDAVHAAKLIKGSFPARYGGMASSILEVETKNGNKDKIAVEGGIGLMLSKITVDGPIGKNTVFMISGRRSYLDLLAKPTLKILNKGNNDQIFVNYYLHDLNGKITRTISPKSKIAFAIYRGKDNYSTNISDMDSYSESRVRAEVFWGNFSSSLRWEKSINQNLKINSALVFSNYNFGKHINDYFLLEQKGDTLGYRNNDNDYFSGIRDISVKTEMRYNTGNTQKFDFGISYSRKNSIPTSKVFDRQ